MSSDVILVATGRHRLSKLSQAQGCWVTTMGDCDSRGQRRVFDLTTMVKEKSRNQNKGEHRGGRKLQQGCLGPDWDNFRVSLNLGLLARKVACEQVACASPHL